MGKAKKTKKDRFSGSGGIILASDANKFRGGNQNDRFKLSELEADLGSLEENKRRNACALLSDLYLFNSQNRGSMEAIASNKLLSKLAMRLVDHSILVRVAATRALKTLTESKDEIAIEKVISNGIFRTVLTLVMEVPPQHNDTTIELQQNLLYIIANILLIQTTALDEIIQYKADFFAYILSVFASNNCDLRLINTIANFFIIVSKLSHPVFINQLIGIQGITIIQTKIAYTLHAGNLVNSLPNSITSISFAQQDHWIIILQCIEIVLNFYFNDISDVEMVKSVSIHSLLQLLSQIWSACLQVAINPSELAAKSMALYQAQQEAIAARENSQCMEENDETMMMLLDNNNSNNNSDSNGSNSSNNNGSSASILQQSNELIYHLELLEMISDWMSTMTHYITASTSVSEQKQKKLESFLQCIDGYHWNSLHLTALHYIHTLLPAFILPDTTNTTATTWLITPAGVQTMDILSHLITSLADIEQCQSYYLQHIATSTSSTAATAAVYVPKFDIVLSSVIDHVSKLNEYLNNLTPLLDTTTNAVFEKWRAQEAEKIMSVKTNIIQSVIHSLEYLSNLAKHVHIHLITPINLFPAPIHPDTGCVRSGVLGGGSSNALLLSPRMIFGEEELKMMSKLILQLFQVPQLEVLLQCTALIQQYFLASDTTTSTPKPMGNMKPSGDPEVDQANALFVSRMPISVFFVLSNVLLRRLAKPNTFAYFDLDHTTTAASTTAIDKNKNKKQLSNVTHSQLLLLDNCINLFIDLHSLDLDEFHEIFMKLHGEQELMKIMEEMSSLYETHGQQQCSAEEQENIEETLSNLMNFIQYKQEYGHKQ